MHQVEMEDLVHPSQNTFIIACWCTTLRMFFFTKFEQFSSDSLADNALNITIGKQTIYKQIESTVHNIINF